MAVKKEIFEKTICIDLSINLADDQEVERYNSLILTFSVYLFQNEIGTWGGRETGMAKNDKDVERTNYWYVLESSKDVALAEFKRMVKNYRLNSKTKIVIGQPYSSKTDYKSEFKKKDSFVWSFEKEK